MTEKRIISVREAQEQILSYFHPNPPVLINYLEANQHVITNDIHAPIHLPPFDNSSMDGYALIASDTNNATPSNPVSLKIIEDIPAGKYPKFIIQSGEASRIMTGAPLPTGADAVIPVEDTDFADRYFEKDLPEKITIFKQVHSGDYIRPKGQDIQKGQKIFSKGHFLRPQDIGMLSGMGISEISVHKKPRIALLTSGDEIIMPGEELIDGQIYDVNTAAIHTKLTAYGAEVNIIGLARDQYANVHNMFEEALKQNVDLIVSTAGVSMGVYDYIRQVINEFGSLHFWKVNIRPGKPLTFGDFKGIPFIGLPGNPVSAFIGTILFVQPVIKRLLGICDPPEKKFHKAILLEDIDSDGRESYLRVVIKNESGKYFARLSAHQGSGNIYSLVAANALLIVPAGVKSLPKGSEADFFFLD